MAQEVLEMTENILAIRRKKESSMVKTMMLGKKKKLMQYCHVEIRELIMLVRCYF